MKFSIAIVLSMAVALGGSGLQAGQISPNDDVTTRGSTATNYDEYDFGNGAYAGLLVKGGSDFSWIEFSLGGTSASSAALKIYNYWTANGVNYDVRIVAAAYNFNETALTGANKPDTGGWTQVVGSFHVNDVAQWYSLDVTTFYNAHLSQTVTFKLEPVTGSGDGPIFADREGTGGHPQHPYLDVTEAGAVAPVIQEVSPDPDSVPAGTEYVEQLTLIQGSSPVTWSVVQGPTGLVVNQSGYVSGWTPGTGDAGQTFDIEIEASNAHGSDTEAWQVNVGSPPPPEPYDIFANDDCYVQNGANVNGDGILVKTINNRHGWVEFTLDGNTAAAVLLRLYEAEGDGNTSVNIRGGEYDFNETTFTGTNTDGWTSITNYTHTTGHTWYEFDVTDFYNNHLGQTVTFHLKPTSSPGNGPRYEEHEGSQGTSNYPRLRVTPGDVPPIIAEVSPDPDAGYANIEYTEQLALSQGTPPITWSVVQGPAGVTVNSSGYVSGWTPTDPDIGQNFTIEIEASNTFGSDTETWQVNVQAVPAPIINEVTPDPDTGYVGTEYTEQLSLSQGAGVSWSVDQGPTELTVSQSGYVSGWTPDSGDAGDTFTIIIRASNTGGDDTETWDVVVTSTGDITFPGAAWEFKTPAELGLNDAKLTQFVNNVGGVGCIVRQGYMVKTWGTQSSKADWASAAKPVISTMLFFAVKEGLTPSVNDLIGNWGWSLITKDQTMQFYHLANMTSGYARGEAPGARWAYNDYAINLYAKTLFDRVYGTSANAAATHVNRLGALQFQDGSIFSSRGGYGLDTSPRDFARIGWFWVNKGNWDGTQLLAQSYFDDYMKAHVPSGLPRTSSSGSDYLGVGTYGGGSDQTADGPGVYGFNWWCNPNQSNWPDAPADTVQANGHWGGEVLTIMPSLSLVVACRGNNGGHTTGGSGSAMNQNLKLLVEACPVFNPNPPNAVIDANPALGQAPLTVNFDGSNSSDPEGPIAGYQWDFTDDGTIDDTGATASHQYTSQGNYAARLIVTDGGGLTDSDTIDITVTGAPVGSIVVDSAHPAWLKYEGGGPFFMCGPGDPEGFLYRGSRNPDGTRNGDQMTLINKVIGTGANCIYMQIVRSHGGDGGSDENPFVGSNINNPVDQDIINQWETWFTQMDNNGITIFLIFYDDSSAPFGSGLVGGELDSREAYLIDTIVNEFEHHKHLIWCVAEEYGEALTNAHVSKIAERIKQQDDNDHPVAVHQNNGTSFDFNGNPNLDQFAVQYNTDSTSALHNAAVAAWNNVGGLKNVNLAEFQPQPTGSNLRQKIWAIATGGAYSMILFMDIAGTPVSDLQICGRLVTFMEATRFNEAQPYDSLARGNTDYVLADPGEVYIAWGDSGSSLGVNMQAGTYGVKWYDPADGDWVDQGIQVVSAGDQTFTKPGAIGSEAALYLASDSGGPQDPVADIDANPTVGEVPLTVNFDASGSYDPDGTIVLYEWDFTTDGTIDDTGVTTSHEYTGVGEYTATLKVTDNGGRTDTDGVQITVQGQLGDFDGDGDVDQEDFGHLQECLSGSGMPQTDPDCQDARLDEDEDVDQNDFGIFQECMGGPNNPPGC